jgi:hypothetical protein
MGSTERAVIAWRAKQASIKAEMAPFLLERWTEFFGSLEVNEVAELLECSNEDGTDLLRRGSVARHAASEVLKSHTPRVAHRRSVNLQTLEEGEGGRDSWIGRKI